MDILLKFSENLLELILDNDLTPKTFSENVAIDRSVIYKYLRKEVLPTIPNLIAICDYFQCSADYVLGLTSVNPKTTYKQTPQFSERFRELLALKNLSRYKFRKDLCGKNLSFAKQSVDDWYNGKRYPTVDNAIILAKYFDCTLDYLLGRE